MTNLANDAGHLLEHLAVERVQRRRPINGKCGDRGFFENNIFEFHEALQLNLNVVIEKFRLACFQCQPRTDSVSTYPPARLFPFPHGKGLGCHDFSKAILNHTCTDPLMQETMRTCSADSELIAT